MAHGQRPDTISKILAPHPSFCPGPVLTKQSQEEHRGLVREVFAKPSSTLKDDNIDQLTPPVPAIHYYKDCDPSLENMEDTCSEYDNVGSDVEQDYDEVLHLNREGVMDMRYYKQYCPEDGGYIKHAVGDYINESGSVSDQFTPKPHQSTEICDGSQSNTKPQKRGHPFRSHCTPITGGEAEGEVEMGHENRFFFNDEDEIEEVLDGAKFVEDIEETENSVERQVTLYQDNDNERIRKGDDQREREDDSPITRNHNMPGANKKCESSHMGSKEKERQGKGRGRRGAAQNTEHIVSGIKDCTTNKSEQRPKTSSKDYKKAPVRSKARCSSSKQHPPPLPRHSHGQTPADTQKAQPRRETPLVLRPSPTANSRESDPRVIEPSPHHTTEQQPEPLEERPRQPETIQQVTIASGVGIYKI